jgi:VWFA-related protein
MLARWTLLLALWSLAGQTDRQQEPPVFRTEVTFIQVDVHVMDQDGRFVDDLKSADFEIFEDGVPQTAATFEMVDLPMPVQLYAEPDLPPTVSDVVTNEGTAEGHVYALVLDDLHTRPQRSGRVRQVARQFLELWFGENDMAVVTTTGGTSEQTPFFTRNRQLLLEAIDKFSGRQLRSLTLEQIELREEYLLGRIRPETLALHLRALDQEHAFRARTTLSHLQSMSEILGSMEGHKKVILFIGEGISYDMEGFILGESADMVAYDTRRAVGSAGLSNVSFYTLDVRGLTDGQEDILEISRASSGIPFQQVLKNRERREQGTPEARAAQRRERQEGSPLDPRVRSLMESLEIESQAFAEEARRSHDNLRLLAEETGGLAAVNQNDLEKGLHDLIADNRRFYRLGYYPPNVTADGRFRTIEVRVKGKDLDVRARKGYIVPEKGERLADDAEDDGLDPRLRRDLLDRPSPITDLPLRVTAFPFRLSEENYTVGVVAECDIHSFRFIEERDRYKDAVTLSAVVLDEKGAWVSGQKSEFDLVLEPSDREQMRRDGFRALSVLDVPPGSHQLRVGVWEEGAEQKGSVYYDLALPSSADSELVMGGILLSSKSEESVSVASTRAARDSVPFLPSTRREFTTRDQVLAGVQIFPSRAQSKEIVVDATVRDAHGKTVFESKERHTFRTGSPLLVRYQIDLSSLSPGPYVIDVQARGPEGIAQTRQSNIFHVIDSPFLADLQLAPDYVDLLRSYTGGHINQARRQLATWTDKRVKSVVEQLSASGADSRTLRAAILLHTELSAYNAWGLSAETRGLHLESAETLLELIPSETAFDRGWLLTMAYVYQGSYPLMSLDFLDRAERRFPDDPEILHAEGVTYELQAALKGDSNILQKAESLFRRAIKADSELAEAHLRLGRVLQQRAGNRTEEALHELEWVENNASDPYLLYLANLFLGDLHMRAKRFDRAAECYRAAVESKPHWQIAHIALSHALRASGDRSAAGDVMQKALRLPVHSRSYVDGYRLYSLGQLNKVPQMFKELRQGIME